ncbi:MAG TPA: hypothetical protein VE088_07120 [Gaiellaceae bacterium]|nr:hypothetical protein [Gaiellaceae bacterium]
MSRRAAIVAFVSAAAVAAAAGGFFLLSGRAGAGGAGFGYGPGMSGGYGSASSRERGEATLVIRHQYAHCHTWSVDGGPFEAHQSLALKRGATVTVVDDDVMPHRLIELAGTPVTMRNAEIMPMMGGWVSQKPGLMNHMGASTTVTFSKLGVYRFRTRAGEDYRPGIETTGADNVLTLTVTVR